MKLIVTGGMGFIGSNFIRHVIEKNKGDVEILNIDKLSYASINPKLTNWPEAKLLQYDLAWEWTTENIVSALDSFKPDHVVHFAAESHVDNSITAPLHFVSNNVTGTVHLLNAMVRAKHKCQLIHISTDEVYGSLSDHSPRSRETDSFHPNSPYAASKAAAEQFVMAYGSTFGLEYIITRSSNNYGPWQHPEKFIPKCITNALQNKPIPVYGNGMNQRDWIHVQDNVEAIYKVMNYGAWGEVFNIGGSLSHVTNIGIATLILEIMGKPKELIQLVNDRPGHDYRYDVDTFKIEALHQWKPRILMMDGLVETIAWYEQHPEFWT